LTVIAWTCWVLSLGLLWGQHKSGVLHPYCVLFLTLLVLTAASALLALASVSWALFARPRHPAALAWSAGAILPALFWVLLGVYALRQLQRGEAPSDIGFKTVSQASGSLMEAQAVYLYPRRMETARLVMFFDDRVTNPRRDAQVMEAHVSRLEQMTGRPLRAKIFWVRGRLLGMGPMACAGLASGSSSSPRNWETADHPDGLSVDRHELAHAVLLQSHRPESDPPFLLVEGWAESQAGPSRSRLAAGALESRARWLSRRGLAEDTDQSYLRELLGPSWYHRVGAAVYDVGGAFADFLRDFYGMDHFLELYFRCRPGTCEADFRVVLGEDFDVVERTFWQEARILVRGL
jgi:hypothetical protein